MLKALLELLSSQTVINLAAAAAAGVVSILLFLGLRALQRLGQPKSKRRTFSDLPELIHGPQELPDQSDSVQVRRRDG